jgi:hypothetical protein
MHTTDRVRAACIQVQPHEDAHKLLALAEMHILMHINTAAGHQGVIAPVVKHKLTAGVAA